MAFTQKTLDFLSENRVQNSKTWFDAHKADYLRHVIEPLADFTTHVTPALLSIDDGLQCEPKVGRALSRIYRDVRFARDKSLYRDVMWCVFMRNKKLYNGIPGFFFELSPRGFRYGCGYYQASPQSMASIRQMILADSTAFRAARAVYESQNHFRLEAERYKKSKHPDAPENTRTWLDCKSICLVHNSTDFGRLFADDLAALVAQAYRAIAPVYAFLLEAESRVPRT